MFESSKACQTEKERRGIFTRDETSLEIPKQEGIEPPESILCKIGARLADTYVYDTLVRRPMRPTTPLIENQAMPKSPL